ncbi:MAG: hypothetical protein KAT06_00610 [Gammaproteobacteria bacterium]|nr:hypothetical protein [Gammaproteobacteria bacterium]
MKNQLKNIFSPILNIFEKNNNEFVYRSLNRKIVLFISSVFFLLAFALPVFLPQLIEMGFWFVMLVFGSLSLVGLIVGLLGSDKAVAKLLGSR